MVKGLYQMLEKTSRLPVGRWKREVGAGSGDSSMAQLGSRWAVMDNRKGPLKWHFIKRSECFAKIGSCIAVFCTGEGPLAGRVQCPSAEAWLLNPDARGSVCARRKSQI